jgi:DNA-directed RNA polymerase subunit F
MIVVNRLNDCILVSCRDKEYNVMYTKEKFEELCVISSASEKITSLEELNGLLEKVDEICKNNYKEKLESFCPELFVQPITGKHFLKLNGKISGVPIPEQFVRRIKESLDKGVKITPLIKCWRRFLRNKQSHSVDFAKRFCDYLDMKYTDPKKVNELMNNDNMSMEIAEKLATTYEVKITQEGLLSGYKISKEIEHKFVPDEDGNPKEVSRYTKSFDPNTGEILGDNRTDVPAEERLFLPALQGYSGDAFFCEGPLGSSEKPGHFIRIGHLHRLPSWDNVNCDSSVACVKGLHLGGLSYISGWEGDIHTALVDPAKIGAIPDYSGSLAIRVLEYFVYGSLTAVNHSIYHSSEYGKISDKKWEEEFEEILKFHGEMVSELGDYIEENKALLG